MYHFPPRLDVRCDGAPRAGATLTPGAIGAARAAQVADPMKPPFWDEAARELSRRDASCAG